MRSLHLRLKLPRLRSHLATFIQARHFQKQQRPATYDAAKAQERRLKRSRRRLKEYETAVAMAQQYRQHQANVIEILQSKENIAAMFAEHDSGCTVASYEELCGEVGGGRFLYNDMEVRNTMMLMSNMLLEAVVIEMQLSRQASQSQHQGQSLMHEFKKSDDFFSLQQYRRNFYNFKSSQYLNYLDAELGAERGPEVPIRFLSPHRDDSEILERLKTACRKYQDTEDELRHLQLARRIVGILQSTHAHIPTVQVWSFLLDKFGQLGLFNYQQIVYLSLFQYKHQPSVLAQPPPGSAGSITAQLMADHFLHLVQQEPNILSSLMAYQVPRKDQGTFVELLSFLKLDKVAGEVMVIKSPLLSRSKHRLPRVIPGSDFDITGLAISRECMYAIMKSAIDIGLFEYLDLLFDKIVLHSNDSQSIQLSYTGDTLVEGTIFDCELFLIMLDAAQRSNDLGRVMWLLPFIDDFIAEHQGNVPQELKSSILEACQVFQLEGKLNTYQNVF
ncbi:uncharacterized protein LODBEIA_P36190 [Lodderomyces beijingensis]|uniref:Mitochondrial mRNA-processing protein COX24 C-terminal domain-containing protein n=1 Tax=Lodderomyces beijingensis TaxID=1775926 RepID=A0ABP0ZQB8_9ASCO